MRQWLRCRTDDGASRAGDSAGWYILEDTTYPGAVRAIQLARLLEVGNLLLSAQRRKRITADKRRELAAAAALRIKVDREPVAIGALDDIAAKHGLTAYDAAYLELAQRRGLPLGTVDSALTAAMTKAGVPAALRRR